MTRNMFAFVFCRKVSGFGCFTVMMIKFVFKLFPKLILKYSTYKKPMNYKTYVLFARNLLSSIERKRNKLPRRQRLIGRVHHLKLLEELTI